MCSALWRAPKAASNNEDTAELGSEGFTKGANDVWDFYFLATPAVITELEPYGRCSV